jgi:hypothetical protein
LSIATAGAATLDQNLPFQEVPLLSVAQLVLQCGFLVVCDVNSTPLPAPEGIEWFRAKRIYISFMNIWEANVLSLTVCGSETWSLNVSGKHQL